MFKSGKRLLLTGATGFLGRSILREALGQGFEVHAVTRSREKAESVSQRVRWHLTNLLETDSAAELVRRIQPTHIIHGAWDTRHGIYWTDLENLLWVAASLRMIAAFAEVGGERFVQIGSCAEYDWGQGLMIEDATPERPATLYGCAKLAVHRLLHACAAASGFSAATARIFFAYGPYEDSARLIPSICRELANGGTANLAKPTAIRDLLYVDDAAKAIVELISNSGVQGAVNVASGEPVSLSDIGKLLEKNAGLSGRLRYESPGEDEADVLVADISKLAAATGWRPSVSLSEGLAMTYLWWSRKGASQRDPN